MTAHPAAQLPDNTPVIIGAGQCVQRLSKTSAPPFQSPMQLAAMACDSALRDAGVSAGAVDTVAVIRLFSDAAKVWASPFGGSNNPPESVARRIGATPARRIYSDIGGTEPLKLLMELLQAIARGEIRTALLTGAEAIATQRHAVRNGWELDWKEEFDAPLDRRDSRARFAAREEVRNGLMLPAHFYALIENRQAHGMGHNLQQHRHYMAQLMAPFSAVAAANPYAQSPLAHTPQTLAQPGPGNYPISLPYTKLLVAQDAVNQGAALLLTSAGQARRLGVDPSQWIFLESYAEGTDQYLAQREDTRRSDAMARVLTAALDRAGAGIRDMDLIDLYSCFPCAVQAACDVLGLPTDGSRPLTVTGGLPYFGGPGNNYTSHALAEVAVRLRGAARRALVTANGGMLSKHAAVVLTSDAGRAVNFDWDNSDALTLDCTDIPTRPLVEQAPHGRVVTYTVIARPDKGDIGVVLAETPTGERFLASSTEPSITGWMQDNSPIGRSIDARMQDERQVFSFSSD